MDATHTPGPWKAMLIPEDGQPCILQADEAAELFQGEPDPRFIASVGCGHPSGGWTEEDGANARLIADAPDMHARLIALTLLGWDVERRSLYDEEGCEGWAWIEPNGTEHVELGLWDELPPWPDSARAAIAAAKGGA